MNACPGCSRKTLRVRDGKPYCHECGWRECDPCSKGAHDDCLRPVEAAEGLLCCGRERPCVIEVNGDKTQ